MHQNYHISDRCALWNLWFVYLHLIAFTNIMTSVFPFFVRFMFS
jgi:hypothetical protein